MSYPNRVDRLEARRARRPAPKHPLAHLDAESTAALHPSARDLLEAIRAHTGKPHTEATEGECQAAFAANPAALQGYLDHLLDAETARESTDHNGKTHRNIYVEEAEDGR